MESITRWSQHPYHNPGLPPPGCSPGCWCNHQEGVKDAYDSQIVTKTMYARSEMMKLSRLNPNSTSSCSEINAIPGYSNDVSRSDYTSILRPSLLNPARPTPRDLFRMRCLISWRVQHVALRPMTASLQISITRQNLFVVVSQIACIVEFIKMIQKCVRIILYMNFTLRRLQSGCKSWMNCPLPVLALDVVRFEVWDLIVQSRPK